MSQISESYHTRKNPEGCEECKVEHRERVLQIFKDHHRHSEDGSWSLLSLPATSWEFEKKLYDELGPCGKITGLEMDKTFFHKSMAACPFAGKQLNPSARRVTMDFIGGRLIYDKAARHLDEENRNSEPDYYTGVWLDMCSPVAKEIIECCRRLPRWTYGGVPTVFVITFLKKREQPDTTRWLRRFDTVQFERTGQHYNSLERRYKPLVWTLERYSGRKVKVVDVWQYVTPNRTVMGNVAGVLLPY